MPQVLEGAVGVEEEAPPQDKIVDRAAWRALGDIGAEPAGGRKIRVIEDGDRSCLRNQVVQKLEPLCCQFGREDRYAGEIAPWPVETGNVAKLNRISSEQENNGNRAGCSLGGHRRLAVCGNHGDLTANQIGRQCRQTIVVTLGPAVFDRHVPTLDIAGFCQALPKRG